MRFREARRNDVPDMLDILRINNSHYPKTRALRELDEMFSSALVRPTYIVAEENRDILAFGGFIPSWVDNMIFNIFWVNTHPRHERRGVGSRLMNELISRIRKVAEIDAKMILISTKIPAFYKRHGFKKVTSRYDGDYALMSLSLT